jgi:exodeoxyribonuclease V alpha subunit
VSGLPVLSRGDRLIAERIAALGGQRDPGVELAVATVLAELRRGSVCLPVDAPPPELSAGDPWPDPDAWHAALAGSPLVSVGPGRPADRPLRLVARRLYLERFWQDEELIRRGVALAGPAGPPAPADAAIAAMFADEVRPDGTVVRADPQQRAAAAMAVRNRVTLVAGGPGTGKTWTVARVLAVLAMLAGGAGLRVAVAAPTGKAATRLQQAIANERPAGAPDVLDAVLPSTIHRLLGRRPGTRETFRYHRDRPLPYDVVIVDEMSMVSLPLMARLVEAVGTATKLILVGDPHQLASVEAGAVFGDLVRTAAEGVGKVTLTTNHRFTGTVRDFAAAILQARADDAVDLLPAGGNLAFVASADGRAAHPLVRTDAVAQAAAVQAACEAGDPAVALAALDSFRVLCAHRDGPHGVARWTQRIAEWTGRSGDADWYVGRPVLVTRNNYDAGVFNGETGVTVERDGLLRVAIDQGSALPEFATSRLTDVETLHAMTVHKAQGSQYDHVTFILPPVGSPLLTRELLYTAATRARRGVRIVGTAEAVRAAVLRPVRRASGLGV